MINSSYYLDPFFFMSQGLSLGKCEIFWEHIISGRSHRMTLGNVEKLMFISKKGTEYTMHKEKIIYPLTSFLETELKAFVIQKIKKR
jgi:hypothetical protein